MFARAVVYAFCLLYLTLGATFTGIVQPQSRLVGIVGMMGIALAWLIGRRRWTWHSTSIDAAILMWIGAFSVSLIANLNAWQHILTGGWFVGAYILAWFLLHDLLANHVIARRVLMNALLITGVLIVAFGYLQSRTWLMTSLPTLLSGSLNLSLPRPVSTLGNPNTLGAFLAVLLPFTFEAARGSKRLTRVLMLIYALLVGGLLVLTYSRGAWVGAAAGVGIQVLLLVWKSGWLSINRLRLFWNTQNTLKRAAMGLVAIAVVVILVGGGFIIARSYLSPGGRSSEARVWIYNTALRMFSEKPISGFGLFTFGTGLARYNGYPPYEPHTHAHNLILHIAAELGVIGLIALALLAWLTARGMWRNLSKGIDPVVIAGVGGVSAFAVHHLFDVPTMNPAIALTCLIALVIAVAPTLPVPMITMRRRVLQIAIPLTAAALVIAGMWTTLIYQQYAAIITQTASGVITPLEGASRLQSIVDADPNTSIYVYEQGLLYGLAGDVQSAIQSFERFTQLEPDYAFGWLNLYALYAETGDFERALGAVQNAKRVSPFDAMISYDLAETYAILGDEDSARENYRLTLINSPDLSLLPTWDDDPIRASVLTDLPPLSGAGETILLIQSGDLSAARQVWTDNIYRLTNPSQPSVYVVDLLLALHEGDSESASAALIAAQASIDDQGDSAWAHYGEACLARFNGDEAAAQAEFNAARESLTLEPFETDWQFGASIAYAQFMRLMLPRIFLPEVNFPIANPIIYALLDPETLDTSPETRYSSCP